MGLTVKSSWLLYNIPADINGLPEDSEGVGIDGYSDKMKTGYDPMCSGGPGLKTYHITVWALSAEPKFTTDKVQRTHLLEAIQDITLAEATLNFTFGPQAAMSEELSSDLLRHLSEKLFFSASFFHWALSHVIDCFLKLAFQGQSEEMEERRQQGRSLPSE